MGFQSPMPADLVDLGPAFATERDGSRSQRLFPYHPATFQPARVTLAQSRRPGGGGPEGEFPRGAHMFALLKPGFAPCP